MEKEEGEEEAEKEGKRGRSSVSARGYTWTAQSGCGDVCTYASRLSLSMLTMCLGCPSSGTPPNKPLHLALSPSPRNRGMTKCFQRPAFSNGLREGRGCRRANAQEDSRPPSLRKMQSDSSPTFGRGCIPQCAGCAIVVRKSICQTKRFAASRATLQKE